jgi:hypothetical protein
MKVIMQNKIDDRIERLKQRREHLIFILNERAELLEDPLLSADHETIQIQFDKDKEALRELENEIDSLIEVDEADKTKRLAKEVSKILGFEDNALSVKLSTEIDPKLVFVIIAFRDDMKAIFEGIKAAGESYGLNVKRVIDVPGDYRITDQIIQMITSARFIVADLTHERPNVYFELGYARGMGGKTVITTAREGTNVHFDVKDWTYIPYTDSRILEDELKKRFEYELSKGSNS